MILYKPTKIRVEAHQRAGSVGKKDLKIPNLPYMAKVKPDRLR